MAPGDPSAHAMIQVLQAMTPAKRLETVFYLARLARQMMLAQAAQGHPEWTNEQVNRHVAARILRGETTLDLEEARKAVLRKAVESCPMMFIPPVAGAGMTDHGPII